MDRGAGAALPSCAERRDSRPGYSIARRVLRGSRKRGANRRGSEPAGSTLFGLQSLTVLSAFVFGFGCGGIVGVVIGALLWLRSRQDSPAGQELVVVNNRRSAYQLR